MRQAAIQSSFIKNGYFICCDNVEKTTWTQLLCPRCLSCTAAEHTAKNSLLNKSCRVPGNLSWRHGHYHHHFKPVPTVQQRHTEGMEVSLVRATTPCCFSRGAPVPQRKTEIFCTLWIDIKKAYQVQAVKVQNHLCRLWKERDVHRGQGLGIWTGRNP